MATTTMHAKDTVSAASAECYITIGSNRYNLMQAISVEATMEKTKTTVPILGKVSKGNKATGASYKGKAKFHYNTSILRNLLLTYATTGEDVYFDMQLTNEDPASSVGRQTVILHDCNLDGGTIAAFDADGDILTEEMDFTFESWTMPETFSLLSGMTT